MSEIKEIPEETNLCGCGCGQEVNSKYKQGHDARHAGEVARAAAETALAKGVDYSMDELYEVLPSQALRIKAKNMAARLVAKKKRQSKRVKAEIGTVRHGRWDYPARKNARGEVVRNTKRDGSGTWTPVDASAFKAN